LERFSVQTSDADGRPESGRVDTGRCFAKAGNNLSLSKNGPAAAKVLGGGEDLSALFGLDIAENTISNREPVRRVPLKPKRSQLKSDKNTTRQSAKRRPRTAQKKRFGTNPGQEIMTASPK